MQSRLSRLAPAPVLALLLPAQAAQAFDQRAFDALALMRTSRVDAVERVGTPDAESCSATLGVKVCHLAWKPLALFGRTGTFRATFVGDLLIHKSTTLPCTKEQ